MRTCLCTSPYWTRCRVGTKRNETLRNIQWQQITNPKKEYGMTTKIRIPTMRCSWTVGQIFGSRIGEWRSASAKVVSFCNSKGFSGYCRNPEEHQQTERWLLLGGVRQKGPGPKPAQNVHSGRPLKNVHSGRLSLTCVLWRTRISIDLREAGDGIGRRPCSARVR